MLENHPNFKLCFKHTYSQLINFFLRNSKYIFYKKYVLLFLLFLEKYFSSIEKVTYEDTEVTSLSYELTTKSQHYQFKVM